MARFIRWLLLTALVVGVAPMGTSSARSLFWTAHGSWSDDHVFRHKHQYKRTKSDLVEKARNVPKGPLLIIISIADQRISLYDDAGLVARSSVSTGVRGHPTPLGVFSVIGKQKWHRSNIYSDAPMPYMQRITWSGIALHAGVLPGYPASHGCIRMTNDFAIRLWHLTKRGTRVIIAPNDVRPIEISNPRLFAAKPKDVSDPPESKTATYLSNDTVAIAATHAPLISDPKTQADAKAPDPASTAVATQKVAPISIFVSRKLSKLFVRQGFNPVFDVPVKIQNPAEPMGTYVFSAMEIQNEGASIRWTVVPMPERSSLGQRSPSKMKKELRKQTIETILPTPDKANAALNRIEIPQDAVERIAELLTPGSSLIISDYGISDETGNDTDFIVLTH